jgi:hypothetical protein
MKVKIISGQYKGRTGSIRGDLDERRKTLGAQGKVVFHPDNSPPNCFPVRIKHLSNEKDLFE